MCSQRYRVQYSAEVATQLAAAHADYPREIATLLIHVTYLGWGVMTVEELRDRGKLVWSDRDGTDYLYQHANAGGVCLSLTVDEGEMRIEITSVIAITYARYGPLERGRKNHSGTRTAK